MVTIAEQLALAIQHHQAGRLHTAEQIYRQILAVDPNHAGAIHLLGVIAYQVGKHEIAVEYIRRAIELQGNAAAFHDNLGAVYQALHKIPEAVASYRRALELQPDAGKIHNSLGIVLQCQGNLDEAVASYRRALELKPDFAEGHNNLGNALKDQGQMAAAVDSYGRALELKPDLAEVHNNLGTALMEQGELTAAVACYRRALELKPDLAVAHSNLGTVLKEQGQLDEAAACFRQALELNPDDPITLGSLVHALQHLCCWDGLHALSQRVIEAVNRPVEELIASAVPPFGFLTLPIPTTAEQQLRCAGQWVNHQLKVTSEPGHSRVRGPKGNDNSRITIGYLSADFHSHATAWLMAELIEKHDRDRFAVFGYSYGADDASPMRRRLVQAFDRFVDVRETSFQEAAQRIADDGVDILVDLKGYTTHSRSQILALRPAPIQVNYLGYPGTMGAPFMDYILVDDFVVPLDQQPFFTEKLVHLPGCYQVNDSRREISVRTPSRTQCGLPEQGFVFCSFNNSYKITPEMFGVWMELLREIPGSVLWLLEGNRFVSANLSREAQLRGIPAERLVFAPYQTVLSEHLARHRVADLFLDSFPVNAHTTASDALWAGCPVLTLAGTTFASRVAGSLLCSLDLRELVTTSLEEYRALAIELARNKERLADLRTRLAANRITSGLFSGEQFARNVEKAYLGMWEIYVSGEKPRTFAVSPT